MSEVAERFRSLSAQFSQRAEAVPDGAWANPAPCAGWVARDVVGHLVGWVPAFFLEGWGLEVPALSSLDDDPAGAWRAVSAAMQAALDDPSVAERVRADNPMGPMTFEQTVAMICLMDVLVHTWDLARATGLDETLDPKEVGAFLGGMEAFDDAMRGEHYGARVPVADDADPQTRLIAFTGRQP